MIPKASLFVGAHHGHGRIKMLAILFISDETGCRTSGGMLLPVAAPLVIAPEGPSCYCAVTTGLIGDAVASRGDLRLSSFGFRIGISGRKMNSYNIFKYTHFGTCDRMGLDV
jgi:hypothetical protein